MAKAVEFGIEDLKANRIPARQARAEGYCRITAGYNATQEIWAAMNAARELDRGGIDWCVVKSGNTIYLGRKGAKMPETWDDGDQNPDGWDFAID